MQVIQGYLPSIEDINKMIAMLELIKKRYKPVYKWAVREMEKENAR